MPKLHELSRMNSIIKKALTSLGSNPQVHDSTVPHHDVTLGQLTTFVIYCGALVLYLARYLGLLRRDTRKDVETDPETPQEEAQLTQNGGESKGDNPRANGDVPQKGSPAETKRSGPPPPPTFDEFLKYVVVFGAVMVYFYLCDYVKVFPAAERVYNKDTFLFLVFLLFLVGCAFTLKPTKDAILNRDQTEEWKGWMQVMFVWYHYFAAKDWYNWIRVYIACYVWMTGFGNFSFFWVRKDFSLWRILKMMFRLNFLVLFVVLTTNNEYMLYYICAMHTYWFVTVYIFMRVLNSWNENRYKMAAKFAAYIICNALIFEIPGVCSTLFYPLWFIFGLHESKFGIMHEWEFRAGLDHWACLTGMLCAYNYPHFEAFIKRLEKDTVNIREKYTQLGVKFLMILASIGVGCWWYYTFMLKDKYDYNKTHCYSSMIPILVFIVLRNSFPILRRYYIHMLAWLGKITLETYLSQLHIYLQSNAKQLIAYIVDYPLLNFSLATIIYLIISYILFNLTTEFSAYLIPKDLTTTRNRLISVVVVFAVATGIAFIIAICFAHNIVI